MAFRSKMWKKIISLGLVFGMIATSAPLVQTPIAARAGVEDQQEEEKVTLQSVREEAAASYENNEGFDIDLSNETFGGSSGLDYSEDTDGRHYMKTLEHLRAGEDDQTLIIRFKTTNPNGLLFGAGTSTLGNGKNMVIGLVGGKLRILFRNVKADGTPDAGLKGLFGSNLADGKYHTAALSFQPTKGFATDNVCLVIDGNQDVYAPTGWGSTRTSGFNQGSDAYTKFEIGSGFYTGSDATSGGAAFNGTIDFLTVINKAYSEEQLQGITAQDKEWTNFSEMFTGGTCYTWLFTGGTEGVASFAANKTTRNWVGLFEDSLRAAGSFVERGRFVFNTSKKDADVAQILSEYDTRIAPFGTSAVGIMIGASDYSKGEEGIPVFKENLQTLMEKITADLKRPLILTPYPSVTNVEENGTITAKIDEEVQENVTLYTNAIHEVAGTSYKVVDLNTLGISYLDADNGLTAAGHQAVANLIKDAVGTNTKTAFGFNNLSDGSYTVAKQTDSGELAQVSEVSAEDGRIMVKVDAASAGGDSIQLEYTLTDTKGAILSASIPEGEAEFTVDGLKEGETYTLMVYDVGRGNVKESYQPVRITVADGEIGTNQAYEDGNRKENEKIQSLLTSEEPATWLFMGDSITHGIVTQGYDNVPQMFAKYLDELGRTDDIVLNTGVSNATIATTLDQIEPRLERYQPDVVMVMLGTNDSSYKGENIVTNGSASTGGITVDQYKERYKELVQKIYDNNPDTGIVLRVPCEMIVDSPHAGYIDKFNAIYDVASKMEEELTGLNITVVDHRQEWLDYQANIRNDNIAIWSTGTYGWLVDSVHPNGRGNLSMFQQIIKELGLYVNTSEIANYRYNLNEWKDSSDITASVTQRASRANFDMSSLSGYANGLKTVTLTLTDEDGRKISKTEAYPDPEEEEAVTAITLDGLDEEETYTAEVTGKDAVNSKEISFQTTLTEDEDPTATEDEVKEYTDSLAEAENADMSSYPECIRDAYADAIAAIKEKYSGNESWTVDGLDAALEEIRLAGVNAVQELSAREEAVSDLREEIESAEEASYQESDYTVESWKVYSLAYNAAKLKIEDGTVNTAELKNLLEKLILAQGQLKKQMDPGEQKPPAGSGEQQPPAGPGEQQPPAGPGTGQPQPGSSSTVIEQGKVYPDGDYNYKVTSISKRTVELTGAVNKKLKKITVTNQVVLGGDTYKVTSIAASAFKGNQAITGVTIGSNVETIGKQAFSGCIKLKTAAIKSTKLAQIGAKAFYNCKKLKSITITSKVLKKVGNNAFKGTAANLAIKVPKAKYKTYVKLLAKKGQNKKAKIKK